MVSAPPLRAAEIFCASGGLAMGFREAGIEFSHAFDFSADACASYEANLGTRPIQIDARDLLRMRWDPGPLDLLVADPPCAMWSRAGLRQGMNDSRDMLAVTVELVRQFRPRAALIGNIPGLEDAPNLRVVQDQIGGLTRDGYVVDFAVLDAVRYGVAQFRKRPYWYLRKPDTPPIRWPAPTHDDPRKLRHGCLPGMPSLLPWVTCRDALGHLPVDAIGRPVMLKHEEKRAVPRHPPNMLDEPADGGGSKGTLVLTPSGNTRAKRDGRTRGAQSSRIGDPAKPAATIDTRPARVGVGDAMVLRWPWDRPATTVLTTGQLPGPGHGPIMSRPNAIVLSELAAMILQGFPEGWRLIGDTKRRRWAMIGEAVPIPVARALGGAVLRQLRSGQ